MKEVLLSAVFAAAFAGAIALQSSTAFAADVADEVALCARALDDQGLASADDYRAKFQGRRGGRVTKLEVRLVPKADGKAIDAVCEIRRGEVVSATLTA